MKELPINVKTTVVCGDWHQNIKYIKPLIEHLALYHTSDIIHVGDVGFMGRDLKGYINYLDDLLKQHKLNLYFIEGNHEDFDWLSTLETDSLGLGVVTERIKHIPRLSQYKIGTQTYTFIGGGVSVDQDRRRQGIDWWPAEEISEEQLKQAFTLEPTDILISHDGPTSAQIYLPHSHYFDPDLIYKSDQHRQRLEEIRHHLQPKYIVFGHYHVGQSRTINIDNQEVTYYALDRDGYELIPNIQYIELKTLYL